MYYLKKYWPTLAAMAILLFLAGGYTLFVNQKNRTTEEKEVYKSFAITENEKSFTNLKGEAVDLVDYVKDVTVVNSWASWSPISANELITLSEVASEFKDKNVQVIAINRSEPASTAKRFLKTVGEIEGVDVILDSSDKYFKSIEGYSMPETIIYDSEGNISAHIRGKFDKKRLVDQIEKLINKE